MVITTTNTNKINFRKAQPSPTGMKKIPVFFAPWFVAMVVRRTDGQIKCPMGLMAGLGLLQNEKERPAVPELKDGRGACVFELTRILLVPPEGRT